MRKAYLLIFIFFFSCSTRPPIATYIKSELVAVSADAVAFDVTFSFANTNNEPVELLAFDYSVFTNNRKVYTGLHEAQLTIPRQSEIQNAIPVVINRLVLTEDAFITWQLKGQVDYLAPDALAKTLRSAGLLQPSSSIFAQGKIQIPN
tara:strand:- start:68 stop:511 length:444 start_codon:yes stop_codon:yes gene_type:complete